MNRIHQSKKSQTKKSTSEFTTNICLEEATDENPFVAKSRYIKGYECQELWRNCNYMDVLFLHFNHDLPSEKSRRALEILFIGLMNLGPREVENRVAMIGGISKTRVEHLLPMGLLAGESCANEVQSAQTFINKHSKSTPQNCLDNCEANMDKSANIAPGFGASYGAIDPILQQLALDIFHVMPDSKVFNWCTEFNALLQVHQQGWLASGLTAAVCESLGINGVSSVGLYQLAKSVGIVAYGMEQARMPMKHAPLLADEHYEHTL